MILYHFIYCTMCRVDNYSLIVQYHTEPDIAQALLYSIIRLYTVYSLYSTDPLFVRDLAVL